jgi:Questin oxidase-like
VGTLQLSDHLPMSVAALDAMGADAAAIRLWSERYATARGLHPADRDEQTRRAAWRRRIDAAGRAAALNEVMPQFAETIRAAGFHCAIRAAYAFEGNDDDELACALESWEREALELAEPARTQTVPVGVALQALARVDIQTSSRGLISARMHEAASAATFADVAGHVPPSHGLDELARAAAVAFAESRDFNALHVMTGTAAMRALARFLDEPDAAMPGLWRAYAAAAYVAGTLPSLDPERLAALRNAAPPDWPPLLAAAIAHDDEHVIKATYTAWRLDREIGDPVFRTAAMRYLAAATPV